MGITRTDIKTSLDAVARKDRHVRSWLKNVGYPETRVRPKGYNALLRTLVGQQVSVAAAKSIYAKLETVVGDLNDPLVLSACDDETLRSGGLSRQKMSYARALADAVITGALDFRKLPRMDDETAIKSISAIHGFGRWSAEIYLMFAEGRKDIWPSDDLALQEAVKRIQQLPERPKGKATIALVEHWRPHRSVMSLFCWHVYANSGDVLAGS
jgi:DNA-3-methyladenine glycosylase II